MRNILNTINSILNKGSDPKSTFLLVLLGVPVAAAIMMTYLVFFKPFNAEKKFISQYEAFTEYLHQEEWKAIYIDPKPELKIWENCKLDITCPGNPKNQELFVNGEQHLGSHVEKVRALRGKRYWISRVFPKEKIIEWKSKGVDRILLGYFYATIQVFINGENVINREGVDSRLPVFIMLPDVVKENLNVAVRLLNDMDEPFPDSLFISGAITPVEYEKHLRDSMYNEMVRPALGTGFSLGIGFLFLIIWLASWRRQEFAAFAMISILQVPSQVMAIIIVWLQLGNYWFHRYSFVLSCYHAISILFLGLTISRIRTWFTSIFILILLIVPWLYLFSNWTTDNFYENTAVVYNQIEWGAYIVSAILILIQARIISQKRGELWDPYREHKMYVVISLLLIIAFGKVFNNINYWDMRPLFTQFVLSFLAVMMVAEYRRQSNFINRSSISKYHQMAKSLDSLTCWVISIDLKNSEKLFRLGAELGIGGSLVKRIIFQLSGVIISHGGELITSEGDSIIFFIPIENNFNQTLEKSIDLCIKLKMTLKEHLKMTDISDEYELRVAVDNGVIRPIWHDFNGKKVPGWEQVGSSNVFVDLARMLEAESANMSRNKTGLVLKPDVAVSLKNIRSDLDFVNINSQIKHGRRMDLSLSEIV